MKHYLNLELTMVTRGQRYLRMSADGRQTVAATTMSGGDLSASEDKDGPEIEPMGHHTYRCGLSRDHGD